MSLFLYRKKAKALTFLMFFFFFKLAKHKLGHCSDGQLLTTRVPVQAFQSILSCKKYDAFGILLLVNCASFNPK